MAPGLPAEDAALLERAGLSWDGSSKEPGPPAEAAPGLFRDEGWLRRVSREPVLLFGGARALLLEVAHPLVAAGVAEHSDFERDPWGRLQRTLQGVSTLVFGARGDALAAARTIAAAHRRVRGRLAVEVGPFPAGAAYSGRDPELVQWVWGTLVDSALAVYRDFVGPLGPEALAEYHREQRALAVLLGADPARVPGDAAGFRRWFDAVVASDALCVGPAARAIARALLATPGADRGPVAAVTAASLPPRLREAYGLAWDAERAARYRRLAASVRALRAAPPLDAPGQAR